MTEGQDGPHTIAMPDAPALVVGVRDAVWMTPEGEVSVLDLAEATTRIGAGAVPFVCHARAEASRLGMPGMAALDLLELFAFVRPAQFCVPSATGLAAAMHLPVPTTPTAAAATLMAAAHSLLAELTKAADEPALPIAWAMVRGGWSWGPVVLRALGAADEPPTRTFGGGLRVWMRLPKWQDRPPEPPAASWPVEAVEARAQLVRLLGAGAEDRPEQMRYASHVAAAFQPRDHVSEPRVVLAEAGTGVGKTLGYIAAASVWARKNHGVVWISTYTRNLQRQLDRELDRLYPDPQEKTDHVVVRKGRENYLCLLNYAEAVTRADTGRGADAVPLGLMARWALATRDGDMVGGDFPAWLADVVGPRLTIDLTDTRGECIHGACDHYQRCFVERSIRKARRAEIVVANHALVMTQAALGGGDDHHLPTRYVFDEGHHLFTAADGAFSASLGGRETADLRRWLLGAEARGRSRSRGLRERIGDLAADDEETTAALDAVVDAARALPGAGWRQRLTGGDAIGPAEAFLAHVRQQVFARARDTGLGFDLECDVRPPVPGLVGAAGTFDGALGRLGRPLVDLLRRFAARMDDDTADLDSASRQRIDAMRRAVERRAISVIAAWRAMLRSLEGETPPQHVDWYGVARRDGREMDVAFHRHWVDPMRPFAAAVAEPAHGLAVTSATLRDATGDDDADWASAEIRTGVRYLRVPPVLSAVPSPFDYPALTRVFVATDVARDDPVQVATAYRELFVAAGGGGLGLFTAVHRLREVHRRIAEPLAAAGLKLLAQHVDPLDVGTLIDVYRAEEDTCLLGTDAVRDGVDVPGRSLRLIVFDRVPWPRPDILHRARRDAFGGRAYDEMLTRLRLKQAFGRLVRRLDDRGVFVVLDRQMPSRLADAFPPGVPLVRVGLRDAIVTVRDFLAPVSDPAVPRR